MLFSAHQHQFFLEKTDVVSKSQHQFLEKLMLFLRNNISFSKNRCYFEKKLIS